MASKKTMSWHGATILSLVSRPPRMTTRLPRIPLSLGVESCNRLDKPLTLLTRRSVHHPPEQSANSSFADFPLSIAVFLRSAIDITLLDCIREPLSNRDSSSGQACL